MGRTKSRPRPLNKHTKFLGLQASPRHRLEKRNIYKLCISKLARIDDPQAKLCKAVLINNTLKNLEKQPEYLAGAGPDNDDDMTEADCDLSESQVSPSFSSVCSYLAAQSARTDEDTLSLCDDIISEFLGTPEECQNASNFICDKKRKIEDDKENVDTQEEEDSEEAGSKSVSSSRVSPYSYSSFLSEVYSVTLRKMKYKVEL